MRWRSIGLSCRLDIRLTVSYVGRMETTRLSSKGQIILPKAVRDSHNWLPGTDFTVEVVDDGVLLRPVGQGKATRLSDVVGCLKYDGPTRTLDDMDAAITTEIQARRDRGRY
jgi:AbrB family looped-hinge helix DNA binding protein